MERNRVDSMGRRFEFGTRSLTSYIVQADIGNSYLVSHDHKPRILQKEDRMVELPELGQTGTGGAYSGE
jgi:hypothetical protein